MSATTAATTLLVKARSIPPQAFEFGVDKVKFHVEPLFTSIGPTQALGAAAPATWHVLAAPFGLAGQNPWDLCHQLMQDGLGIAGAPNVEFAEPDIQQRPIIGDEQQIALAFDSCSPDPPDAEFPPKEGHDNFWFRDQAHSQFDAALDEIGGPGVAAKVRIAHLDTGYDPTHATLPQRLRKDLARNFVDDDSPDDASDASSGALNNLGHGTGTIGILAGAKAPDGTVLGGAPFAEVVPIRVANRVVLFSTRSVARALDYVHRLNANPATFIDIVTMSMGGLASQAWADAVNALYDQGVFVVAAAGNNFGNLPTRHIVYPARFNRVTAACGVMFDHAPYADLGLSKMAGNYGPKSKMRTAMAACTPNLPWAKFGCGNVVRFNGAGTSAATPQIAAAAALWIQKNRAQLDSYPKPWMRVEALRKALFETAIPPHDERRVERLGRGELRAKNAMANVPKPADLRIEEPDTASFAALRILTGLGATQLDRMAMLELEALQLSQSAEIETLLPEPDVAGTDLSPQQRRELAQALAAVASATLRAALPGVKPAQDPPLLEIANPPTAIERLHLRKALNPPVDEPTRRPLRIYASDPSLGKHLETLGINETTVDVVWEKDLAPGPVGEYVEVIDVDPASRCCYAPVDLNHPHLLLQHGLCPSESNPQFHQQMAYAVAMKTIEHFETALGRVALWAPRRVDSVIDGRAQTREEYVPRLRIYPHALRTANAFYSPERKALLLGYFDASSRASDTVTPGNVVFSALSHDIVAHETTHALLDGLHRRFTEPTNPDVLAFHEGFSDIVALFQHFTMAQVLRHQIARTRGDLSKPSRLAELARQFGEGTGRGGALRSFVGTKPTRDDYNKATEAHDRGAVLVAAVFDAFWQLYAQRSADLVRLATQGTGVLPQGDIPVDLKERLAQEASKVAAQVLRICIRALDFCPPVDITLPEYLRALITADSQLMPDDSRGYRTAIVSAFRDRGIYPPEVKHLSPSSLVWEPPPLPLRNIGKIVGQMDFGSLGSYERDDAHPAPIQDRGAQRAAAYRASHANAKKMHAWLLNDVDPEEFSALGLTRQIGTMRLGDVAGELRPIEVHSVRQARRVGPDGQMHSDLVIEVTQTFRPTAGGRFRGGCTLVVDLEKSVVRYFVSKRITKGERLKEQQAFMEESRDLRANYFDSSAREPFAMLHRCYE